MVDLLFAMLNEREKNKMKNKSCNEKKRELIHSFVHSRAAVLLSEPFIFPFPVLMLWSIQTSHNIKIEVKMEKFPTKTVEAPWK